MTDIIDFNTEKQRREDCLKLVMPNGTIWYKYSLEYEYDCPSGGGLTEQFLTALDAAGVSWPTQKTYAFEIWATNDDEAIHRAQRIKDSNLTPVRIYKEVEA